MNTKKDEYMRGYHDGFKEAAPEMLGALKLALHEMRHTVAPRNSFTDAVDVIDAAISKAEGIHP